MPQQMMFSASTFPTLKNVLVNLGLTTNLKLCLDSGDISGYVSGQSWLDTSGGGYDFFRGADINASTDDPTFNGVSGSVTKNEYFSYDGGDFFQYDTTNESWMDNLHKNNAIFSIVAFYYQDADLDQSAFFTTAQDNTEIGINFSHQASGGGTFNLNVPNGVPGFALSVTGATDPADTAWHMASCSLNEATGAAGGFLYLDGAYNQVAASDTFTSTYTTPSAAAATRTARIGWLVSPDSAGQRIACIGVWEGTALTKANMDSIWAAMRSRFGL